MVASKAPASDGRKTSSRIACIGTGFSGIGMGATLKRWYNFTDITFFDRSSALAGTWTSNQYPGCACDVPGALYSFSYEQNPKWTRVLPQRHELKDYLEDVANKYDLPPKMHFRTEVETCVWSDKTSTWTLHLHNVETNERWTHESQILISCAGGLVVPRPLDVPGVESFRGPIFHTAKWDYSVDLKNKNVAVIGNGCTGVQVIPGIIDQYQPKSLAHFVRSQHWIFPPIDRPYPERLTWAFKNIPGVLRLHRLQIHYLVEKMWPAFDMTDDAAEVRASKREITEGYMRRTAPKEYLDMLVPDWEVGCRRRIYDSGYLKALHDPKVELTNKPIREIVPEGLRTDDGITKADAIILANGFDVRRPFIPMTVYGKNGIELNDQWSSQGGPGTYSTVAVNNFPNFFLVAGPNTATGHTSVVIAAENTTNLILRILKPLLDGTATTVEPLEEAEKKWTDAVQEESRRKVWFQGGCSSWYVQGQWVPTLYPWSQFHHWRHCFFPTWSDWAYKSSRGTKVRYWGLDRFTTAATVVLLSFAAVFWLLR